jgi:hypothetical protein
MARIDKRNHSCTQLDARMNGESINDGDEQWADARMSVDATAPTAGTSTGE